MKLGLIFLMAALPLAASATANQEYVILLHGLCRTSRSMAPMGRALSQAGYHVVNVDYPSRSPASKNWAKMRSARRSPNASRRAR